MITVTGTLSSLRASAICLLDNDTLIRGVIPSRIKCNLLTPVYSPSCVRLRLGDINREALILTGRLFQHPEDDSGVRVSQDYLIFM